MEARTDSAECTPREGMVFPGTWPDCPDCHGNGYVGKNNPTNPCQTCQERSKIINRSLGSLVEFDYYSRPRNHVSLFPYPGEKVQREWVDIAWAEVFYGTGVPAGTWPDCPKCRGLGLERYESSWDGHRADMDWRNCGTCQHRTRTFHVEYPNEKDVLLRKHVTELKAAHDRYQVELEEMRHRHQAELDALPY